MATLRSGTGCPVESGRVMLPMLAKLLAREDTGMANLHAWKLSAAFVKSAPVGRHIDGHGLMLVVQASGTRSWIQRIVIQGKRRDMGLGGFPLVIQEAPWRARG